MRSPNTPTRSPNFQRQIEYRIPLFAVLYFLSSVFNLNLKLSFRAKRLVRTL